MGRRVKNLRRRNSKSIPVINMCSKSNNTSTSATASVNDDNINTQNYRFRDSTANSNLNGSWTEKYRKIDTNFEIQRHDQQIYFISNDHDPDHNIIIPKPKSRPVVTKLANGHCLQWWSTYFTALFYMGFMPCRIKLDSKTGNFVLHTHRFSKTISLLASALSFFSSIGYLRSMTEVKVEDDSFTLLNVIHLFCSFSSSLTMLHLFSTGFPTFLRIFNLVGPHKFLKTGKQDAQTCSSKLNPSSNWSFQNNCNSDTESAVNVDVDLDVNLNVNANVKKTKKKSCFSKIKKGIRYCFKTRFQSIYYLLAIAGVIFSSFEDRLPFPWNEKRQAIAAANRGFVNGLFHPWTPLNADFKPIADYEEFDTTFLDYFISILLQIDYTFISIGDTFFFFTVFFYGQLITEFCQRTQDRPQGFLQDFGKVQSIIREMNSVMRRYLFTAIFANIPMFVWRIPPILLLNSSFGLEQARYCFIFTYYIIAITFCAYKQKQLENYTKEWIYKRENSSKLESDRLATFILELNSSRDMELSVGLFALNPSLWASVLSTIAILSLINVN